MRSTAASSSRAPSVMNRVTMWPGPYRRLISAMRSPAATGSPGRGQIAVPQRIPQHPALIGEGPHLGAEPALNLNVSIRCGWMPHLRQIRATLANEMPSSAARNRADQCVIPSRSGGLPSSASVATTTSASLISAGRTAAHLPGP